MVGGALETGRERPTKEKVIVSIDRHFMLELAKMKEGVRGSRIVVEDRHHELPQKAEHGDFSQQW